MEADSQAYCASCKRKQIVLYGNEITISMTDGNSRRALRGICAVCDGNIFAFLPANDGKIIATKPRWRGVFSFLRRGSD